MPLRTSIPLAPKQRHPLSSCKNSLERTLLIPHLHFQWILSGTHRERWQLIGVVFSSAGLAENIALFRGQEVQDCVLKGFPPLRDLDYVLALSGQEIHQLGCVIFRCMAPQDFDNVLKCELENCITRLKSHGLHDRPSLTLCPPGFEKFDGNPKIPISGVIYMPIESIRDAWEDYG
jgi:hypothetical protein